VGAHPRARAMQVDAASRERRAADDGRRADLRVGRRHATAPSGTPPRWGRPSAALPPPGAAAAARYANGGFLHYGQGKWYPGEQLAALGADLSSGAPDGEPCWNESGAAADETRDPSPRARMRAASSHALTGGSASILKFIPGFEDTWYYLWRERRLPVNVDPVRLTARRPERAGAAAARVRPGARQGSRLRAAAGAQRAPAWRRWVSGPWFLRDERCTWSPAIRRWAIACRWIRCRGCRRATTRTCTSTIRRAAPSLPLHADIRGQYAPHVRRRRPRKAVPVAMHRLRRQPPAPGDASTGELRPRPARVPALRVGPLDHAHRAVCRGARRRALRLHAAAGARRRLPRSAGDRGGGRPRSTSTSAGRSKATRHRAMRA
jgi:hypothetical protein